MASVSYNAMNPERKTGQMFRILADMRDVRHCHSSLSLKINVRMMTRLGVIPGKCKAR